MQGTAAHRQVERNVAVHDKVAEKYDAAHAEIFNPREQARLRHELEQVARSVTSGGTRALDFGCGSGNLTRHLTALGFATTSADVSPKFLKLVERRFADVTPHLMPAGDASGLRDASFDLVATYSVLHHVPDYLGAVRTMARVCKPGGVVYIDHEPPLHYWRPNPAYRTYQRAVAPVDWRKFLSPMNYVHRLWRVFDPRHTNEGDIHVWPDDHIEWDKVEATMHAAGFTTILAKNYLLYRARYRADVYAAHEGKLSDMRCMAFRKAEAA